MVHFDMPMSADAYLHRSGRAGRFETNGLVVSFVVPGNDNNGVNDVKSASLSDEDVL